MIREPKQYIETLNNKKLIFSISKSLKFSYITQLKYCKKLDFEAGPINKLKPLITKLFVSISKSINFPFITQLKYCPKLDFEADPINKLKPLRKKTLNFFRTLIINTPGLTSFYY